MSFRKSINQKYSIYEAWTLVYGSHPPSGKCFCPFHHNVNSPAAKVYDYGIRCFGQCNRVYNSYDLLSKFRPDIIEAEKKVLHPTFQDSPTKTLIRPPRFSGTTDQIIDQVIKFLSE